ncbi:uncharacterized protein LOC143452143 [Clavelina lepadiformis]|uniref:uncharacterized protein LOC143452143 n=1 Tax=Clavelina lepadiformis TaxID=159417 RepID=UPI004042BAE3
MPGHKTISEEIPIVDYSLCGLRTSDQHLNREDLYHAGKEMVNAFSNYGFLYLINSGVNKELLQQAKIITDKFFNLEKSKKQLYSMEKSIEFGYVGLGREEVDWDHPCDVKEAFSFDGNSVFNHPEKLPEDICPGIVEFTKKFMTDCRQLSERIMDSLSIGMELKEESDLKKCHQRIHKQGNISYLRLNYYGSADKFCLSPGQIRLGEHTDFSTFTLLFQDNVGGLQLERDGIFVDAFPLQDAILIMAGDSLNFLSCGQLKAAIHRVIVPEDEVRQNLTRYSFAYLVDPDNDAVINRPLLCKGEKENEARFKCLPPPLTFGEYIRERYSKIRVPIE